MRARESEKDRDRQTDNRQTETDRQQTDTDRDRQRGRNLIEQFLVRFYAVFSLFQLPFEDEDGADAFLQGLKIQRENQKGYRDARTHLKRGTKRNEGQIEKRDKEKRNTQRK